MIRNTDLVWCSREKLPHKQQKFNFNVWKFIKNSIGEDLSKVVMPVTLNEPVSFLQRLSEYLEYSELLDRAAQESDSISRLEYVSAFIVSSTASNFNRIGKPFNPLLGETYELQRNGFQFVAEQVSHHPPVSAFHAESESFILSGVIQPKLKLTGKEVKVVPAGTLDLTLKTSSGLERYTWKSVHCIVHNIIVGDLWIEHAGSVHIQSSDHTFESEINFHANNGVNDDYFSDGIGTVTGVIRNSTTGQLFRCIYGNWTCKLYSAPFEVYQERFNSLKLPPIKGVTRKPKKLPKLKNTQSSFKHGLSFKSLSMSFDAGVSGIQSALETGTDLIVSSVNPNSYSKPGVNCQQSDTLMEKFSELKLLWVVRPRPEDSAHYYNFTDFTMGLNELPKDLEELIPHTDSRYRPDLRAFEAGNIEQASSAKTKLEESQRAREKSSKAAKKDKVTCEIEQKVPPLWFHVANKDKQSDEKKLYKLKWVFNKEAYNARNWSNCLNLYD